MSALEFFCGLAFFWLTGLVVLIAFCAAAKRGDQMLREYMRSLADREQRDELERLWDLPSREPVR